MKRFRVNQPVIVNTGGDDCYGTAFDTDKRLGVLVYFENGTKQWIPAEYVRERELPARRHPGKGG